MKGFRQARQVLNPPTVTAGILASRVELLFYRSPALFLLIKLMGLSELTDGITLNSVPLLDERL